MNITGITGPVREPQKGAQLFEEIYTGMLHKDHWLCSDDEAALLPCVQKDHPHYKEWLYKKTSCKRLIQYLKKKQAYLDILDVGCGNGWLSYQMAKLSQTSVTGMDINPTELNQAKRVFAYRSNLEFISGDIRSGILWGCRFDIVVFTDSLQYFHCPGEIIEFVLRYLLKTGGEVHILDTPFYTISNVADARQKSIAYYIEKGFPEMAMYHFHHTLEEISSFPCKIMYNPTGIAQCFTKGHNPFHWIRIKEER